MTKAGSVAVSLSCDHCLATAWWLSHRFFPFALERWRRTGNRFDAYHLETTRRLVVEFVRFARRRLKGCDQERDAARTLARADAAWLAAMILSGQEKAFPVVLPKTRTGDFPSNEQLAAMPLQEARAFVFGWGTDETMRRCHERAYSKKTGPKSKSLTLAGLENKQVGNAVSGGDERYERRLRKRAKEDEIAAKIADEWKQAMRAHEARSNQQHENFP